ncbi:hypothetical protein DL96DRAFT_1620837 [Flagelloscypha sp. PMI_526]|nr:hypothetical protein DL96DRAFT_1620837 [Flagelloscypha sp. PMI_526]
MGREFGSSERGMLEQLETPGLCQNLRRFVLRCLEWKSSEMIRLFDGLAQLGSSLRELFLFLPSYSTNWLLRIAKSTPRLESLHLVIAKQWYTNDGRSFIVHIPYSIFAKEVVSECGMDPELQAWKLCDITIRELGYDMRAPESNAILMTAIASVVTTIYSFTIRCKTYPFMLTEQALLCILIYKMSKLLASQHPSWQSAPSLFSSLLSPGRSYSRTSIRMRH